jgi:hypothetical protein
MKELLLEIRGLEPCPRNRSHVAIVRGKFAQIIKTEAAKSYEEAIHQHLTKYILNQQNFIKEFDEMKHALKVDWIFGTPDLYTRSRKLSNTSVDLDAHKVLQDSVMSFVGIDDSYIIRETRAKEYSPDHCVMIFIQIIDNGWK